MLLSYAGLSKFLLLLSCPHVVLEQNQLLMLLGSAAGEKLWSKPSQGTKKPSMKKDLRPNAANASQQLHLWLTLIHNATRLDLQKRQGQSLCSATNLGTHPPDLDQIGCFLFRRAGAPFTPPGETKDAATAGSCLALGSGQRQGAAWQASQKGVK